LVTQFGVDPTQVTRLPLSGWWLAEYPATLAGPAERSSFTKMLAASGFYTSPVLRSDDGQTFATPTPALLVRFKDGIPAEWAERVISEVAGASAVFDAFDTDTQGRSGLYRVVPSVLYGEEVLRLANRFASRRDVDIAEADMLFSGRSKLGDMPVEEASFWQNGRLDIAVIGDGNQSVGMIERHAAQFLGTHAAVASVGTSVTTSAASPCCSRFRAAAPNRHGGDGNWRQASTPARCARHGDCRGGTALTCRRQPVAAYSTL